MTRLCRPAVGSRQTARRQRTGPRSSAMSGPSIPLSTRLLRDSGDAVPGSDPRPLGWLRGQVKFAEVFVEPARGGDDKHGGLVPVRAEGVRHLPGEEDKAPRPGPEDVVAAGDRERSGEDVEAFVLV